MSLQRTLNQKTEKTGQVSTKPQTAPVEALEKSLAELRERVIALEVKTSTMETGLSEVCRALEISGLMKDGEAVTAKKESVPETVFTCLNWGVLQSPNLGSFKAALKKDNDLEKWSKAYDILQKAAAAINKRFLEPGYVHGYWLWAERPDRIFAKELKQGAVEKKAETFNPNLCGVNPLKKER
jgi:hypothetical protein